MVRENRRVAGSDSIYIAKGGGPASTSKYFYWQEQDGDACTKKRKALASALEKVKEEKADAFDGSAQYEAARWLLLAFATKSRFQRWKDMSLWKARKTFEEFEAESKAKGTNLTWVFCAPEGDSRGSRLVCLNFSAVREFYDRPKGGIVRGVDTAQTSTENPEDQYELDDDWQIVHANLSARKTSPDDRLDDDTSDDDGTPPKKPSKKSPPAEKKPSPKRHLDDDDDDDDDVPIGELKKKQKKKKTTSTTTPAPAAEKKPSVGPSLPPTSPTPRTFEGDLTSAQKTKQTKQKLKDIARKRSPRARRAKNNAAIYDDDYDEHNIGDFSERDDVSSSSASSSSDDTSLLAW